MNSPGIGVPYHSEESLPWKRNLNDCKKKKKKKNWFWLAMVLPVEPCHSYLELAVSKYIMDSEHKV